MTTLPIPGDIIFFKPKKGLGFENFATLADYAQSYPYRARRPWHHVAICTQADPLTVIGFETDATSATFYEADIKEFELALDTAKEETDVLRPPPDLVASIVSKARETIGREYSVGETATRP